MTVSSSARCFFMAAVAAAALAACGGGGGAEAGAGGTTGTGPARHKHADRIEPLDTKVRSSSAVFTRKSATVQSQLPAGAAPAHITLPAPTQQQVASQMKSASLSDGRRYGALPVGFGRQVVETADNIAPLLTWSQLADGSQVAAITFTSSGALGIRIPAVVHALPEGAVLRFSAPGQAEAAQQYSSAEIAHMQSQQTTPAIHGPYFDGPSATLEIHIPAAAEAHSVHVAVPRLQHLTHSVTDVITKDTGNIGHSGACNLDSMCHAPEAQRRAVAKFLFEDWMYHRNDNNTPHDRSDDFDEAAYKTAMCTGTLMNNTADDKKPYFSTAWHCISSQAAADTVRTYWFFHSAACGQRTVNPSYQTVDGGAKLLFTQESLDFTLLELKKPAPSGVVFSGSYIGANPMGASIDGVHNPKGDLQKYSAGSVVGWSNYLFTHQILNGHDVVVDSSASVSTQAASNHIRVRWTRGTTEGGSSGSGLLRTFDGNRYLIGVLSGGDASCAAPNGTDDYGRFDKAWAAGNLARWLRPN